MSISIHDYVGDDLVVGVTHGKMDSDPREQYVNVNIHHADHLSTYNWLHQAVRYLPTSEAWSVRLFSERDRVTFFVKDPMQFAELLHSLADSITDAVWHQEAESQFDDCDCPDHEHRRYNCPRAQEVTA